MAHRAHLSEPRLVNTTQIRRFAYPYEEFADHVKAMRTVREWEYTSRFGHLGKAQTSRAHCSRVVEFYSDSYPDPKEAVYKADIFLLIYDYIGRHATLFARKGLLEQSDGDFLSVDAALLRAVHYVFSAIPQPNLVAPKQTLTLAKALQQIADP